MGSVLCPIPASLAAEFESVTSDELEDLKEGILEFMAKGKSRDETVDALKRASWSPEAAEWAVNAVRLYGKEARLSQVVHEQSVQAPLVSARAQVGIWIVIAILCEVAAFCFLSLLPGFGVVLAIATRVVLYQALATWAWTKGHARSYGWLCLVPAIGILVVFALPDVADQVRE